MRRCAFALFVLASLAFSAGAETPTPLTYYAGMAGRLTIDRDDRGGNPFATALIDTLSDKDLTLRDFGSSLAALTQRNSGGWQMPEIPRLTLNQDWSFQANASEDRVALVLVNSDFGDAGISSLPGALNDSGRVSAALARAGFETVLILDADGERVRRALETFSRRSASADVSLVYLGGHGVQHHRMVYWMFGDYPDPKTARYLESHALSLADVRNATNASKLNFVLYAACRDDPFLHD